MQWPDVIVKGTFKRPFMESFAPIVRAQIEKSLTKLRPVHVAHHDGTDAAAIFPTSQLILILASVPFYSHGGRHGASFGQGQNC